MVKDKTKENKNEVASADLGKLSAKGLSICERVRAIRSKMYTYELLINYSLN